jgi:hypothetical protein
MRSRNKSAFVNSRPVTEESRVACALHHSLKAEEPLWLMIPIDEGIARKIESVILVTNDEAYEIYDIDDKFV